MAKIQWKLRALLQKTKNYIEEGGTLLMHYILANKQLVCNLSIIIMIKLRRWFHGVGFVTPIVYWHWLFVKYSNGWLLSVNFASETNLLKITFRSLTYNHFTSWGTCTDTALEPLFWFVDHFVKYLGPVSAFNEKIFLESIVFGNSLWAIMCIFIISISGIRRFGGRSCNISCGYFLHLHPTSQICK